MQIPETEIIVRQDGVELLRKTVLPGDYVIGRDGDCDLPVQSDTVSVRHAQLTINHDHALIEDLGSDSGTFVNGQRVTTATRLWPSQKIQIGAATVELHRKRAPADPEQSLDPQTEVVRRLLPQEILREQKYDIGGQIAKGGMGAILSAKEIAIRREVAMKVMLGPGQQENLRRFVEEAQITGQLEHPNIVPVHELSVDENDQVFYTMKLVRGVNLRQVLEGLAQDDAETIRKYPLSALLTVFQKVCDAAAFAHSKGVIHRDLKPDNIMLGDYGEVLVMDWGLAKTLGGTRSCASPTSAAEDDQGRAGARPSAASHTLAGTIMGTPRYMAPEQARGEIDALDARSDIYALGAILYHLLTLQTPIEGETLDEILTNVRAGQFVAPIQRVSRAKPRPSAPAPKPKSNRPLPQVDLDAPTVLHTEGADPVAALYERRTTAREADAANPSPANPTPGGHRPPLQSIPGGHRPPLQSIPGGHRPPLQSIPGGHRPPLQSTPGGHRPPLQSTPGGHRPPLQHPPGGHRPPLQHLPGGSVPESLNAVVLKAMALEPTARYQSIVELQADLTAYQTGFATSAENASVVKQLALLVKRHKGIFITAAAAWLIITALAGWFVINVTRAKQQAENERNVATRERDRAESTLRELRGTAPTFAAQAGALVEDGKLSEALEKISYATGLDPQNPNHHLQRASYLQALQRLAEAEAEYREVLVHRPDDSAAQQNLALCQRLRAESGGAVPLPAKQQRQLLDALLAQGRLLEGIPLSRLLGDANATAYAELKVWLKPYMAQPEWKSSQLARLPDGTFRLDFSHLLLGDLSEIPPFPISDLSFNGAKLAKIPDLSHLPLRRLILTGVQVTDLSPLRGLKLRELNLANGRVSDLSPLVGMPLEQLDIERSNVTDLSPLQGAPLQVLIASNKIRDLGPLAGMPLEELNIFTSAVGSLEPLRGAPLKRFVSQGGNKAFDASFFKESLTLEEITLPPMVYNVEALRTLPRLQHITISGVSESAVPVAAFWAAYQPDWCAVGIVRHRLDEAGVKLRPTNQITRQRDGTLRVNLGSSNLDRLDYFQGFRIAFLDIVSTKVRDLELLRGQPLTFLRVNLTAVTDLRPLLDCPTLEMLTFPRKAENVESLKQLPKLRRISSMWDMTNEEPAQTAEEFWKEFDAQPAGSLRHPGEPPAPLPPSSAEKK